MITPVSRLILTRQYSNNNNSKILQVEVNKLCSSHRHSADVTLAAGRLSDWLQRPFEDVRRPQRHQSILYRTYNHKNLDASRQ